ncbi:MAG: tetratricopeptide repeat protein [Saprospiraceae bacterium]|nr:tetratricopeptide repeat protein [Saprospiraceae bacterium]
MSDTRLKTLLNYYEKDNQDAFIIFALAKEYEQLSQIDKAMYHYLELKTKHSDYIGLYYHLAKLYETRGENEMALQTYGEGIELAKSKRDYHALSELNNAKMNLEMEMDD